MRTKTILTLLASACVAIGAPVLAQDAHTSTGTPHAGSPMPGNPSATDGKSGPDQTNAFHGGFGADGVDRNPDGTTRVATKAGPRMAHRHCRTVTRNQRRVRRCT